MNNDVSEVMAPRVHAVKLDVSHMRKPSDGMPVRCMDRGKGPDKAWTCETICHMGVLSNVDIIVIIQKLVISHLPIHG